MILQITTVNTVRGCDVVGAGEYFLKNSVSTHFTNFLNKFQFQNVFVVNVDNYSF